MKTVTARWSGVAACLVSAACFGALPVLGKQAYQAGTGPLGLLWTRFALAAIVFWVLVGALVRPSLPTPRFLVAGFLMGFGYAAEACLFFLALERIDASLTELLLYAYPVIVTVAAVALGQESSSPRLAGALGLPAPAWSSSSPDPWPPESTRSGWRSAWAAPSSMPATSWPASGWWRWCTPRCWPP